MKCTYGRSYLETIDVVETVLSQGVALRERVVGQIQHAQIWPRLAIDESLAVGKLVVAQIQLFERLCSAHPRQRLDAVVGEV